MAYVNMGPPEPFAFSAGAQVQQWCGLGVMNDNEVGFFKQRLQPRDVLLGLFARAEDPSSGGRQMPNHFSFKSIRWGSISSPIGTQISHAAGVARGMQVRGEKNAVWAWFGDGGTSAAAVADSRRTGRPQPSQAVRPARANSSRR